MPQATPRVRAAVAVLIGVVWAVRSLQSFTDPHFTDPENFADWWAVVSFSLAFAVLPVGLAFVARLSTTGARRVLVVALLAVIACSSVTAAVANLIEDGAGVAAAGTPYFVAAGITMASMLALAGVLVWSRPRWPSLIPFLTVVGMLNLERGGGVIVLLVWMPAAVALARGTA